MHKSNFNRNKKRMLEEDPSNRISSKELKKKLMQMKKEKEKASASGNKTIKCVLVGDSSAGKTNLLQSYCQATNSDKNAYAHTVFDNHTVIVKIDGESVSLTLFDTASQEAYDRLRPLTYYETDVFLICFNVLNPFSFESVTEKWLPEIQHHCPNTPFVLVGTHIDLREDTKIIIDKLTNKKLKTISTEQGVKLAKEINAMKYVECSASTQQGVKNVFNEAIYAALTQIERKKESCLVL